MKNTISIRTGLLVAAIIMFIGTTMAQKPGGAWTIPAKYKAMKNTVKPGDAGAANVGKELFNKHCKSCHGAKGLGDGPKSASLKTLVPSFADKKFKAQSDGEIYFQSFVGRDEMPNFEKKVTDEGDRWAIVSYLKNLK